MSLVREAEILILLKVLESDYDDLKAATESLWKSGNSNRSFKAATVLDKHCCELKLNIEWYRNELKEYNNAK